MHSRLLLLLTSICIVLLCSVCGTAQAADLDLTKAIVIGNGPKKVIEFTDPDCPFCRRAAKYFEQRKDVTKYVFFMPLAKHPEAKRKAQHILSQPDKAKAYHEVMSGKLDGADSRRLPTSPKGIKLLEQQQEIAKAARIDATPTFMIMGRIVEGADFARIEELLGKP